MDMLDVPSPQPLPPLDLASDAAPAKKPVGRPTVSAEQRALSDQKYAQMMDLMAVLPVEAKEPRFHVYTCHRRVDQKKEFKPVLRALYSEFRDNNFSEPGTLANYLQERLGAGRYCIEAYDAHNRRLDKIPAWYVTAGDPDMLDDDQDRDDLDDDRDDDRYERRSRGRGRRRPFRDEDLDDDPLDQRANMADLLVSSAKSQAHTQAQSARASTDALSLMMLSQSQANESRQAEERRREEARIEERKRDENRAEERRREEVENRRREDAKAADERKEEQAREERRREEAIAERRREEQRRDTDHLRQVEASNKRTELLLGALTAAVPLITKLFEKREDPIQSALITRMTAPPPEDPVRTLLLKSILDKSDRKDGTEMMVQQMIEFSKISSQMTAEQMRGVMTMSADMNREMLKRAMSMMESTPQGQTPEGKNFLTQMMEALAGAGEFAKAIFPAQPAQPQLQPPQQRRALPHQRQHAQPQQQQPAPQQAAAPQPPVQPAVAPEEVPTGVTAVLACLMAIHTNKFGNAQEHQNVVGYLLHNMPVDLRVAVLEGSEPTIFRIVGPYVEAEPECSAWFKVPANLGWVRNYVAQLRPHLEAMYGPLAQQQAELAAALAAQEASNAAVLETSVQAEAAPAEVPQPGNEVVPQPGNEVQPPPGEQPPGGGEESGGAAAAPVPAPEPAPQGGMTMAAAASGSVTEQTPAAPAPSHLSDPDAP